MDHLIDDADRLPELPPDGHPLRMLGARLAELLDEDQFAECERLLLEGWEHDQLDRETGAHWRENSSLEVWFPFTAEAIATAYGYLWHVNNEPGTPNQYPPERAAYEARKLLRDQMTHEKRGDGINRARELMGPNVKYTPWQVYIPPRHRCISPGTIS
jgi:hypothetical protein